MLHSFGVARVTCVDFLYEFRDVCTKATTSTSEDESHSSVDSLPIVAGYTSMISTRLTQDIDKNL